MNAALRYLLTRSILTGIKMRLWRLRQPKYLVGAVLGIAYFYLYFYKFLGQRLVIGGPSFPAEISIAIGALALFVLTLLWSWLLPASRAAISFTEAEIAFLFPAPISRRTLVAYKLLRSQFAFLIFALVMTLITGRFRYGPQAWFAVGTLWAVFNTLSMHRIAASFALQRLRERGLSDGKRRIALLLAAVGLAALVEYTRRNFTLPAMAPNGLPDVAAIIDQLANHGPLRYVLVPFKMMVAPFFARDLAGFAFAMLPVSAIMLAHFVWVISADTAFEEASISSAQKRAALLASVQKGEARISRGSPKARTPLWRLKSTGFAPLAFLWKALIKFGGRRRLRMWTLFFLILAAAAFYVRQHTGPNAQLGFIIAAVVIGLACYITVLLSLVMVGQNASAQLRQGMTSMDLLKTYPIPGWQLALGELIGPVVTGTLLQWCALGVGAYLASVIPKSGAGVAGLTVAFISLGLVLPVFNVGMSIMPAAASLLFPGWIKPTEATGPGIENTGIRLIMGIGQLLAIAIALVPPAFFGLCAWFGLRQFDLPLVWLASASAASAVFVLCLESALGVAWLGSLYDRYDGSAE